MNPADRLSSAAILRAVGSPSRLVSDSRRVASGDAFAAYPGGRADGRRFIPQALARGAAGVLWEPRGFEWNADWRVANVAVAGLRDRLGELADETFGHPSRRLLMIGVTGTNGKTTCTHWIAQSFASLGRRAAVLGTLGNGLVGESMPPLAATEHTTMDAALLHETLAALRCAGADTIAMEVSSHGIDQGRVNGAKFDVALFTNLSRDHLDYHRSMDAYAAAKARLFDWPTLQRAVVNVDDAFGRTLRDRLAARGQPVITYGLDGGDVTASAVRVGPDGMVLDVGSPWGSGELRATVHGAFNALNLLGCLAVLASSGVPFAKALLALAAVRAPRGRMERLGGAGRPTVVVDYAHSPDALAKVLAALRPSVAAGGRLVCVFGCGGERDRGKRPDMGRIAEEMADAVVVTSDNPRGETPQTIIDDVLSGLRAPAAAMVEPDRARAIASVVASADSGDVVLIAGKGHETHQEVAGVRCPFDDAEHAAAALSRWRAR